MANDQVPNCLGKGKALKSFEEVNGLKGVWKERKSKPWAVYDVEK